MARLPEAAPIYQVADVFRQRCLLEGRSLLWLEQRVWTPTNLSRLRDSFADVEAKGFLGKWREQLASDPPDVHRVAADLLAFYWLCPTSASAEKKLEQIKEVVSWKLADDPPDYSILEDAFKTGFANPGLQYLIARNAQIAFFGAFANEVLAGHADPRDAKSSKRVADTLTKEIKRSEPARHVLLHLLFPDQFEGIASRSDKQKIAEIFKGYSDGAEDLDDALFNIHQNLARRYGREFDFYRDPEIRGQWKPKEQPGVVVENEEVTSKPPGPRFWVEKTIAQGRPDRQAGEYALGRALWAPQRDKRGADIYRFMRDIQRGDLILHLTDNKGFAGISRADGSVEEFNGVAGTEWGEGRSYLVRLRDFTKLDPPLTREMFFGSPYREKLVQLLRAGKRNLFYNEEPSLNQGAYLTPAPPELIEILHEAYEAHTEGSLFELMLEVGDLLKKDESDHEIRTQDYGLDQLANDTGLDVETLKRWARALERKGQTIIYGPPGTGKTYVAERLARHIISGTDGFVEIVQFHPAYAYEDFVAGIRPRPRQTGGLDYPVVPGRFLEFCTKARDRQGRCVLIIDEINRANLARVLGELMYLLEYRDREIPLATGTMFRIPQNVRLIGTMNTADRSIALVDHALRRRFAFLALRPNYDILRKYHERTGVKVDGLVSVLRSLNAEIGDHHYEVGVSFFLRDDLSSQLEDIWRMEIEPYLEEYFFDQPDKVARYRWDQVRERILQ